MKRHDAYAARPEVELHIEELVLEGFSPHDRRPIGAAVERELSRLLSGEDATGLLARGGEVAHLDGGAFKVAPGAKAEAIGAQVARAIYGGLSR